MYTVYIFRLPAVGYKNYLIQADIIFIANVIHKNYFMYFSFIPSQQKALP